MACRRIVATPVVAGDRAVAAGLVRLCAECLSTLATVRRETNSWRQVWIMAGYLFALAYLASLLTYQIARLLGA